MSKVTIWDMDFYYKKSFYPNPTAMKLSSFHKQEGDLINFVQEEYDISMSYDIFYIIREKSETPRPPGRLIDDKRVRLIGRPMRFFDNFWTPPAIVSAVRPDYMLYPENPRDAYYNANIVQFYHNGELLKLKQPFENSIAFHKKTLVVDKEFWEVSEENIISCLQELEEYKNIAFLHPINLKKILKSSIVSNLFKNLHFSQGTIFRFRNNYGQDFESAQNIFDFMNELKLLHPHVRFTNVPFKAITVDHWQSKENGLYDLERCLKITDMAKQNKVHIRIISPSKRLESPYWYYFEMLEYWTLNLENLSYIEMMTFSASKKTGLPTFRILNDSKYWITPNTNMLLRLMIKTDIVDNYGFRRWGEDFFDKTMLNYNEINKFKGILNSENAMEENKWQK